MKDSYLVEVLKKQNKTQTNLDTLKKQLTKWLLREIANEEKEEIQKLIITVEQDLKKEEKILKYYNYKMRKKHYQQKDKIDFYKRLNNVFKGGYDL